MRSIFSSSFCFFPTIAPSSSSSSSSPLPPPLPCLAASLQLRSIHRPCPHPRLCSGIDCPPEMVEFEPAGEDSAPSCIDAQPPPSLPHGLDPRRLPRHVAFIMDGNSRWAKRRALPSNIGHSAGVKALKEVVKISCKWGIEAITVFAFSTDNFLRSQVEVDFLMRIFEEFLRCELAELIKENVCVHMIGDRDRLPASLLRMIALAEEETRGNTRLKLCIAVAYSGRYDIVRACQKIASKVEKGSLKAKDITEATVEMELETSWVEAARNPDLVIRTSGEQRISNFLLWQLAYSEFYFCDAFWPDFGETLYATALLSYQNRDRRFGRRTHSK